MTKQEIQFEILALEHKDHHTGDDDKRLSELYRLLNREHKPLDSNPKREKKKPMMWGHQGSLKDIIKLQQEESISDFEEYQREER